MKYKTVFVPAIPARVVGKGFLSGGQEKDSDCWIDGETLAEACETACNQLAAEGYDVISIAEVTRGSYNLHVSGGGGWGMNQGMLVTARRS